MKTKKKALAILVAVAMMITLMPVMAFADSPEDYDWNAYTVKMTTGDTLAPGQNVTFSVSIKNNKSENVTPSIYHWYYREHGNSETYPGVEFGTVSGSGYDSGSGKISLAANGELNLTLTGTLPDTWNDKSEITVVLSSDDNNYMGQADYPDHDADDPSDKAPSDKEAKDKAAKEAEEKALAEAFDYVEWNGIPGSIPAAKSVKAAAGKKSVKVTWNKASKKNAKKFDKVEIQICSDKGFARANTKRVFVKKSAKSKNVKGLAKKTAYYVRVRDVKGSGAAKVVSKWSKVKKVKTK